MAEARRYMSKGKLVPLNPNEEFLSSLQPSERDGLRKINVLVVDDSAFMRVVLQNILREHPRIGKIFFARDGVEAIVQTLKHSPDVVILDVIIVKTTIFLKHGKEREILKMLLLKWTIKN